ncbi:ATP-binding protein [Rhodobacteraceae bacterium]|nr:ATP-binding protein [Paracoccaceae bacterium]
MPDDGSLSGATTRPVDDRGQSQPKLVFDKSYPADFRWVRRAIQNATDELRAEGLSEETLGSVEIVLAEALNNVAEHAYPADATGDLRLIIRRRAKALMFEIRDRGKPMPKGRAPIGNHPMTEFNQHDAMPEGGYGWFLIREIVSDLVYDRHDDENFLVIRMAIENNT